ncbi:hypothetical protein B0H13DRAFT_1907780 [Mycena leptocephala]|nr:hypothetical protein B0H13DRAFT_1907780 [Mycena leptocephala]
MAAAWAAYCPACTYYQIPQVTPVQINAYQIRSHHSAFHPAVDPPCATLDSHDRTIKLLLAHASASAGTAPPAPSAADADFLAGIDDARLRTIIQEMIGTKRTRTESEDENAPKRLAPAVVIPAALSNRPTPRAASCPSSGPPRVAIDPACEVLFGPMDWEKKWHLSPCNLIMSVLASMRSTRFTSRKGLDDDTAILVFEAESVATWFIAAWNSATRVGYECCVAHPNA